MISKTLTFLSLLVWSFGQLLVFYLPGIDQNIYLLDLVIGLLFISLLFEKKSRTIIIKDPLSLPLLVFGSIAAISLLVNLRFALSGSILYSLIYLARLFLYPAIYYAIKIHWGKQLKMYLKISLGTFLFLALAQYLFFPDIRYLILIGFDDHYYRLAGSLYDPNFTGAILAAFSSLTLASGKYLSALTLIVMLALTFSRASYLAFSVCLLLMLVIMRKFKLVSVLAFLLLAIYLIPKPFGEGVNLFRTFSIYTRLDSWLGGIRLWVEKPILGWGYNTLRNISGSRFQIDNSYIYLLATSGLVGLWSYLYFLKNVFHSVSDRAKYFIITLLIHGLFNNTLFYIWIYFVFFVVTAVGSREYKQA